MKNCNSFKTRLFRSAFSTVNLHVLSISNFCRSLTLLILASDGALVSISVICLFVIYFDDYKFLLNSFTKLGWNPNLQCTDIFAIPFFKGLYLYLNIIVNITVHLIGLDSHVTG